MPGTHTPLSHALVLVGIIQFFFFLSPVAAQFVFDLPTRWRLGGPLESIDVDGDGHLDVVGTFGNGYTITHLRAKLGTGTGYFGDLLDLSLGDSRDILALDLNGDHRPDFAVARGQDAVSVFLSRGSEYLRPTEVAVGLMPTSILGADLDGDGVHDLAVANYQSDDITILRGDGDGGFSALQDLDATAGPTFTALADFDQDGNLDLAVANSHSNTVSLHAGEGSGSFESGHDFFASTSPSSLQVGDFDRDGNPDLVVAGEQISLLRGNGQGSLGLPEVIVDLSWNTDLQSADLNQDGSLDLAVIGHYYNFARSYQGHGNGNFSLTQEIRIPAPTDLVLGDYNEDGNLDLGVTDSDLQLRLIPGDGQGRFPFHEPELIEDVRNVWIADFNRDGLSDVIGQPGELKGDLVLSQNLGLGELDSPQPQGLDTVPRGLYCADFNNDGHLDALTAQEWEYWAYHGDGSGQFDLIDGVFASENPSPPLMRDFNEDGYLDLIFHHYPVEVWFVPGSEAGFGAPTTIITFNSATPVRLLADHFDSDEHLDLAVLGDGYNARLRIWAGDGLGGFAARSLTTFSSIDDFVAGDFNEDGISDVGILTEGMVGILLGPDPQGPFADSLQLGSEPKRLIREDFQGDGHLDLVTGQLHFLSGRGTGKFDITVGFELGDLTSGLRAADMDRDGNLDLVVEATSGVHVLFNRTHPPVDCEGDGTPDHLAIHSSTVSDCNHNWVPDECDLRTGDSLDGNDNGILDECETSFVRGDSTGDAGVDFNDALAVIEYLFVSVTVSCLETLDFQDDGTLTIADLTDLLSFLFSGGPPPSAPFPTCGVDMSPGGPGCNDHLACP